MMFVIIYIPVVHSYVCFFYRTNNIFTEKYFMQANLVLTKNIDIYYLTAFYFYENYSSNA